MIYFEVCRPRCLYNKVRYFRGFCVSGVGGAYVFMLKMEQHLGGGI
jgi:hypothetical protein